MMDVEQADVSLAIAQIAASIAEPARARILCALMDGRAYTATELATIADTAASTASAHLSRLTELGLLHKVSQGRHRYFRLANAQVAQVLESMMQLAGQQPKSIKSTAPASLRFARSCYDHLAGTVAVALLQQLLKQGWLCIEPDSETLTGALQQPNYQLTALGQASLSALGVDYQPKPSSRKRYACGCLDWSERTAHLGGQLGAALLDYMLEKQWLRRTMVSRELQFTELGRLQFHKRFALQFPAS